MNWGFLSVALAVGTALVGGVFLAFSAVVMPALAQLSAAEAVKAMQHINVVVLRSVFLVLLMGTSLAALLMVFLSWKNPFLLGSALLYLLGSFLVTVLFNVPLNDQLARLGLTDPALPGMWKSYLTRWTLWNHVRTVASLAASLGFVLAVRGV